MTMTPVLVSNRIRQQQLASIDLSDGQFKRERHRKKLSGRIDFHTEAKLLLIRT